MSALATKVDPLDANWRILQASQPKPLTPRGRSRLASESTHTERKRRSLLGVQLGDGVAADTTPWYRRMKRDSATHPRYHRTKIVLVADENGKLVPDVARAVPKPAPNRRRAACPTAEADVVVDLASATSSMTWDPEEELDVALARREELDSTESQLTFHRDALEASGIVPVMDGLPPFTDRELVLH